MEFQKKDVKSIEMKPFEKIGSEWMLISAKKDDRVNTMTASWGGLGVLWGKNVVTVYIRPQRYTKEFVDAQDTFTLSFFGGEYMRELGYLGKVSGRRFRTRSGSRDFISLRWRDSRPLRRLIRCLCAENCIRERSIRRTFWTGARMNAGIRKRITMRCISPRSWRHMREGVDKEKAGKSFSG